MVTSGPAGASTSLLPIGEVAAADVSAPPVKLAMPPPIVSEWPRLPRRTPDGPNKLYLGGFDPLHVESQMRQVAAAVGELKSFAWMPDDKGRNTGHAFMEYKDPRRTDVAVEALTGVSLGGTTRRRLVCRRACPGATEPAPASDPASYEIPSDAAPLLETPSTTLWVYNAVTAEHDAVAAGEVEVAVRREAAAAAQWDVASVASRRARERASELAFEDERGAGRASAFGSTPPCDARADSTEGRSRDALCGCGTSGGGRRRRRWRRVREPWRSCDVDGREIPHAPNTRRRNRGVARHAKRRNPASVSHVCPVATHRYNSYETARALLTGRLLVRLVRGAGPRVACSRCRGRVCRGVGRRGQSHSSRARRWVRAYLGGRHVRARARRRWRAPSRTSPRARARSGGTRDATPRGRVWTPPKGKGRAPARRGPGPGRATPTLTPTRGRSPRLSSRSRRRATAKADVVARREEEEEEDEWCSARSESSSKSWASDASSHPRDPAHRPDLAREQPRAPRPEHRADENVHPDLDQDDPHAEAWRELEVATAHLEADAVDRLAGESDGLDGPDRPHARSRDRSGGAFARLARVGEGMRVLRSVSRAARRAGGTLDLTSFAGTPIRWHAPHSALLTHARAESPLRVVAPRDRDRTAHGPLGSFGRRRGGVGDAPRRAARAVRLFAQLRESFGSGTERRDGGRTTSASFPPDARTPEGRMLAIVRAILADAEPAAHLRKPFNPVLGETARHVLAFADILTRFVPRWNRCRTTRRSPRSIRAGMDSRCSVISARRRD